VILLSGTPCGGKYEKLLSQCKLLGWGITKRQYYDNYVVYHEQSFGGGYPVKVVDGYKNVDILKYNLAQHGAIFMKTDEVFELPPQTDINIKISVTKEYKKFMKSRYIKLGDTELVGDTPLKKMLYCRQLCGAYNTNKLTAFEDLLQSTEDRLIVFYNFDDELKALTQICGANDRPISVVNGHCKDLSAFENLDNSVTLIQFQSGAFGLNLQKANKIVYFSPPLSSELFEQSKKRTHRLGQDKPCFYYYLTCKSSIEQHIYKVLKMRKDYTERLFEKEFES
jgi:SNF2 family DNA or RNA helicase